MKHNLARGIKSSLHMQQKIVPVQAIYAEEIKRFTEMLSHPETAFLPSELKGIVPPDRNRMVNQAFGRRESKYMRDEAEETILTVPRSERYGLTVVHWGWGLGDDRHHFEFLKNHELNAEIRDFCPLAYEDAEQFCNQLRAESGSEFNPEAYEDEVEQWVEETLDADSVLIVEFPRFLQFLPPTRLQRVLETVAHKLYAKPWRKIIGVHPFYNNNRKVVWNKTYPHSREEIMSALRRGTGKDLIMVRQKIIRYYHQKYSGFAVVERV